MIVIRGYFLWGGGILTVVEAAAMSLQLNLFPLADGGAPLIWATLFQLTIGNLLIGILEAAIVRRVFKVSGPGLFIWLIVANYVSSFAGFMLISAASIRIIEWVGGALPVYFFYRILVCLAVLSFALTILIEWPFYSLALRSTIGGWRRSLSATILANTASYFLLVTWYSMASGAGTHWGVALVNSREIPRNPSARVLYISPDGSDVYQLRLDGSAPLKLVSLDHPSPGGALGFSKPAANDRWRLELQPEDGSSIVFVTDIGQCRAATRPTAEDNWLFSFSADDLQDQTSHQWSARIGFWAAQGIMVTNNLTGSGRMLLAIDAPWLDWPIRSATILPNNQMVFQLGEQIMWVDLAHNTAAAIAAGHGPVVVLDEETPTTSITP